MIENHRLFVGDLTSEESAKQLDDLTSRSEDDLLGALAAGVEAGQAEVLDLSYRGTSSSDKIIVPLLSDILDTNTRGPEAVLIGRRLFWRWSTALHDLLCKSGGADDDLRSRLLSVLSLKDGGAVAYIAVFLASNFKIDATHAAIVATLLVKVFLEPTGEEVCQTWSSSLLRMKGSI